MMKVVFLVPNNAYAVLYGDDAIAVAGERFWHSRVQLEATLKANGLQIVNGNDVQCIPGWRQPAGD